jgi:hypothetical protein
VALLRTITQPLLALVPALVFLALWGLSRRHLALVAALAWAAYVPYELGMKLRILCSGECNIRVDLLLIYPALVVLSLAALVAALLPTRTLPPGSGAGA